jgi:hypothetical protein
MPAPSSPFRCLLIAIPPLAALGPAPTNAQNWPALLTPSAANGDEISFAFPRKTCPGGSELYKGPEQALARASGRVCCSLVGKAPVVSKKMGKRPVGMTAYTGGGRPDSDVMWWGNDLSFRPLIPTVPKSPVAFVEKEPTHPSPMPPIAVLREEIKAMKASSRSGSKP